MKKLTTGILALLLIAALCTGALAEGLTVEEVEWTGEQAVAAAEAVDDADVEEEIASEAVELAIPETEDAPLPGGEVSDETGYADFVGEVSASVVGDVAIDETNFPDENFRDYVAEELDRDGDGVLSGDECASVTEIDIGYSGIADLKGIEWFPNLSNLRCDGNELTSLDLSKNTALKELECTNNHQLTNLDVSGHTALTYLSCYANQLTSLDVRGCTALTELSCGLNQLTRLDLSTNTALTELDCDDNQLTSLDVSKNTALTHLQCESNQLTTLDVSGNTTIEGLTVRYNKMTSLKVRGCTHLKGLSCYGNQLTSLDVSGCTDLSELYCYMNPLTSLEVSNCTGLINAVKAGPYKPYGPEEEEIGFHWVEGMINDYTIHTGPTTTIIANGKVLYGNGEPTPALKSIKKAKVTAKNATYTGKKLKPAVTVVLDGKKLKQGTDYTVKYSSNKAVGTAKVTVTGAGKYTGSAKATFKIKPKKASGLKLKAGKKKLTVTWKKVSGATGYQIQYGTKKDFSNAKKVTVKKAKTVKATLKKLKAKKTYYVRIRSYKTVKGKKYYSSWSKAVKKKTK